jgi:predicted nucleic acid-binding protein
VTIAEIQAGIEITRESDPQKALELSAWLDQVSNTYNTLVMDAETFRAWAKLMHRRSDNLLEDGMIAATARAWGLKVATRNQGDFPLMDTVNPFEP